MRQFKPFAWIFTCLTLLALSACASQTQAPTAASPTLPADTETPIPSSTIAFTQTHIPPTTTRLPTRTRVSPTVTQTILPVKTYTSMVSNKTVNTITPTPIFRSTVPTRTETPVPVSSTPTRTISPTATATLFDQGSQVRQSLQDKTSVTIGTPFQVTWTLKNTGTSTWTGHYALKWAGGLMGNNLYPANTVPIPLDVQPGATVDITVTIQAPTKAGSAFTMWFLQDTTSGLNFIKAYLEVEAH